MGEHEGLVCAYALCKGGNRTLDWQQVRSWKPDDGYLWLHLDYADEPAQEWLREDSGLDTVTVDALLARDPRPRSFQVGDGLMIIIRGVNTNTPANPEDMLALRMWIDGQRIITTRHRYIDALNSLSADVKQGYCPSGTGDFFVELVDRVLDRIVLTVDDVDDQVDLLEDLVVADESAEIRRDLAALRRRAIGLRRHVSPQRELFARLETENVTWMGERHRIRLRECKERLLRIIEELDAARDRAVVTQEEVVGRMSELLNRRLYALSIISAIFLPLGFITGILGVNVGGIPGSSAQWGFAALCGGMVMLGVFQLWLFRRLGWF